MNLNASTRRYRRVRKVQVGTTREETVQARRCRAAGQKRRGVDRARKRQPGVRRRRDIRLRGQEDDAVRGGGQADVQPVGRVAQQAQCALRQTQRRLAAGRD